MPHQLQVWLPRLLTLAQWLCGAGIAYSVATTALALIGDPAATTLDNPNPGRQTTQASVPPAPTMEAFAQQAMFGRPQASTGQNRSTSAPAAPTRLPLTLEAVFVSSAPAESSAIISQRGRPGKLYSPGDTVPGNARLDAVEAERVILRRAGAREALAFKVGYQVKATPAQISEQARVATRPSETARNSEQKTALENLSADLAQRPEETLNRLGIAPSASGGYRIGNESNPYLSQSGLQPGDIVLSINGRPLGDLSVDRLAITNLAKSDSVRVEIMRDGQTLTITSRIPEAVRQ